MFNRNMTTRPIPLTNLYIHNKYVIDKKLDNRHLSVCSPEPYEFIDIQTDKQACLRHHTIHSTAMSSKIQSGTLRIYTPNNFGHHIEASQCYVSIQHRYTTCGMFFTHTTTWSKATLHAVSEDTCNYWKKTELCTANNQTMTNVSPNVYRTFYADNFTETNSFYQLFVNCVNRQFHVDTFSDCVLIKKARLTFRFPYKHIETPLGAMSIQTIKNKLSWIPNHKEGILTWTNQSHNAFSNICTYTLFKIISVTAIITTDVHKTNVFDKGSDENITSISIFKEDQSVDIYRVTNIEEILNTALEQLNMTKCLLTGNDIKSYMTRSGQLLQYINDNFMSNPHKISANIQYKSLAPPDPNGYGIEFLPNLVNHHLYPINENVCNGHAKNYTDIYNSIWVCVNGFPTLSSLNSSSLINDKTYLDYTNHNNTIDTSSFISLHTDHFLPLNYSKYVNDDDNIFNANLNTQFRQIIEHECETKQMLNILSKEVSFIQPSVAEYFFLSGNPVSLSRRGHLHGVHH